MAKAKQLPGKKIFSQEAKEASINNNRVKALLMLEFDKTHKTIEMWIKAGHLLLSTPGAIAIIKKETGLKEDQIMVPDPSI